MISNVSIRIEGVMKRYGGHGIQSATNFIHKENVDVVITDLKMAGRDGMDLFGYVREKKNDMPVIFLTTYGTVDTAVSAMLGGAYHYFIKPPDYSAGCVGISEIIEVDD